MSNSRKAQLQRLIVSLINICKEVLIINMLYDDQEGIQKQQEGEGEEQEVDEESYPPSIERRVNALEKLHLDVGEIDKEYKIERAQLEAKYFIRRQVIFDERAKVISGEVEPAVEPEESEKPVEENAEADDVKGIPGFWFRALANHPSIGDYITQEDIPALEFLTDIKVEYNEAYSAFKLIFYFAENPYFSNAVSQIQGFRFTFDFISSQTLEKAYNLDPDILEEKAPLLSASKGTTILWKPSKDLTVTEIKKKQKAKSGKNKGQIRTITILEPKASFFHYFSDPTEEDEEDEEEDNDKHEGKFKIGAEEDYDIAHAIRTEIVIDAVKWFTGEAVPEDMDYGDDEEEEEDDENADEDDDEDGEDEDDEDEDDEPVTNKKTKGTKSGGGAKPAAGEQPECKQN